MTADDRQDLDGRDRIATLEARYRRVARLLRAAILVLAVVVVGALGGFGILLTRVRESRVRSATLSCERFNDQNRAIRRFIGQVAPALDAQVRRGFSIVADCDAYARKITR